jgi:hypothetical protein
MKRIMITMIQDWIAYHSLIVQLCDLDLSANAAVVSAFSFAAT